MAQTLFKNLNEEGRALHDSWDHIIRMVVLSALLAALVWGVISLLRWIVHFSSHTVFYETERLGSSGAGGLFLIGVLFVCGLIRGILARKEDWIDAQGDGMEVALRNYHLTYQKSEDDPTPRFERPAFSLVVKKWIMTLLTLGSGASGGLEAPSVTIAEALGAGFSRIMRTISEHELRTYQLAAISAAASTLLGAPFAAALFATEVAYGDRIIYRKLAYAMWAAVIAFILNNRLNGYEPLFIAPEHLPTYSLWEYAGAAIVALAVSVPVSMGFAKALASAGRLMGRVQSQWHAVTTSVLMGCVALVFWFFFGVSPEHVLGMGEHTMALILAGDPSVTGIGFLALILVGKMLTTGLCLRGGGSAGVLIPSMFFGGVAGALTAQTATALGIATLDPTLFAVVGICASLVAVIGVPLAAIALVLEVFGSAYGPPAILSCGVTYLITLKIKIYGNQRVSPTPVNDELG